MSEVTLILQRIDAGDSEAAASLLPLVYEELRRLAAQKMAGESLDHTLQATALVHEAYVRLVDNEHVQCWDSRRHFYSAAAEAMRRILVESARKRGRLKRGAKCEQRHLEEQHLAVEATGELNDLVALDEALDRLMESDSQAAELVKLRFFAGLSNAQAAAAMNVSVKTVQREWAFARAWLGRAMGEWD